MDEALTIDGTPIPVLVGSWRTTPIVPGSRGRTETGVLRSVRSGAVRIEAQGTTMFETWAEAEAIRDLLLEPGDHEVTGWLVGGAILTCETDCGTITPIDHRPRGVPPTAMWQLEFRLYEAE